MKYLKTYESIAKNIEIGDYILANEVDIDENTQDILAKITDIDHQTFYVDALVGDKLIDTFIFDSEIIRRMTPEEIKHFKIIENRKKYNI